VPAARYPKAWYALFAFLSIGLLLALAPFWRSDPTPPTFGPSQKALHAELQAVFIAAGASQIACRGAKQSTLVGCSAQIGNVDVLAAELARRGWTVEPKSKHSTGSYKRGKLELLLEYNSASASVTVVETTPR
jgi:hypothetical protein